MIRFARHAVLGAAFIMATTSCAAATTVTEEAQPSTTAAVAEAPPPTSAPEPNGVTTDAPPETRPQEEGVVVHVVDGDTFDVQLADGTVERIRPPQIDTPERGDCGFDESTQAAEDLLLGESVGLTPTSYGPDRDRYDRLLRAVDLDGRDFGETLVSSGLARWTAQYADEDPHLAARYSAGEESARTEGRGFWSTCGW